MAIVLDHTIVPARDKEASARFLARILGLRYEGGVSHFAPLRINETLTLDFDTARAVLIDNNAEVAMAAFMAGRVRVEGDMTKLLAYQSMPPTKAQIEVAAALREITAS